MLVYIVKVLNHVIKRRTFEGINGSSLTSKYMPSYKYWIKIWYDTHDSKNTFKTKRECIEYVNRQKELEGKPL
ncbi:MAG TPA: hypothetical protein ENH85_03150 [Candidatus Scalindua sp.]|nr:hypothetical protein [Candidatus Scalindua sp.]